MIIQLGPPPTFPYASQPSYTGWLMEAVPFLIAGSALLAMLLAVLLRYNDRFREFWSVHVCAWMEEHSRPQCSKELMVERYLLDELTPAEREAVEIHILECARCAASMDSGLAFIETLKRDAPKKEQV